MKTIDPTSREALQPAIQQMAEIACYLWERGWAELNAGNISLDVTELVGELIFDFDPEEVRPLTVPYMQLAGKSFLVTATGSRMRHIAKSPGKHIILITIDKAGKNYGMRFFEPTAINLLPTSELPSHLGIFEMITRRGSNEKAVLHTHATELIALTQISELCSEKLLNELLWGMHPETIIFVPEGVGFVPYTLPGTDQIADKTLLALQHHQVAIWEKHGVFAIGNSVEHAFDLIDILCKSAKIYFACRSAHAEPQGLTAKQLAELKKLASKFA